MSAVLDTSVFVAVESGRPASLDRVPDDPSISVVTLAELQLGVLAARDVQVRAKRLATFQSLSRYALLEIDEAAARQWAELRLLLLAAGRKMQINDLWIGAIARAHGSAVVARDDDFDALDEMGLLEVIKI